MSTGTPNVCEQDLVGFNFQNSGYPLQLNVPTLINDAIYIDTTAIQNYAGTINITLGSMIGITAKFQATNSNFISVSVLANQLIWVPIIVTANDCGKGRYGGDNFFYWQMIVSYAETPNYGESYINEGSIVNCEDPERSKFVCRFDVRGESVCRADFEEHSLFLTGTGSRVINYSLGQNPACTGSLTVVFDTNGCGGVSFPEQGEITGVEWTNNEGSVLTAEINEDFIGTILPITIDYVGDNILCYCRISATTTYDSCNNPNLITDGNDGTFNNLIDEAAFNTAGVYARTTTTFSQTIGDSNPTGLRTQLPNPVDMTNRVSGFTYQAPSGSTGSILWQMDNGVTCDPDESYVIEGRVKISSSNPVFHANSNIHIDHYLLTGGFDVSAEMPWIGIHSPMDKWVTVGRRFKTDGTGAIVIPFGQVNNRQEWQSLIPVTSYGDVYLKDGSYLDWADVTLKKYYMADCIECTVKNLIIRNPACDYETDLGLTIRDCESVDFSDNSDFGYTPGHGKSRFSLYRKLTVTLPNGSTQVLSSVAPYNIHINPASADTSQPFYTNYPVNMGGIYTFTLCNIPTYYSFIAYQTGVAADNVCLLDSMGNIRFFKAIQSMAGIEPLVTIGWQQYWEEISENQFTSKYCSTQTYIQTCELRKCVDAYKDKLYCSLEQLCGNDFCQNECLQNYFELEQILLMLTQITYSEGGETILANTCWGIKDIRDAFNMANKLCRTCDCKE